MSAQICKEIRDQGSFLKAQVECAMGAGEMAEIDPVGVELNDKAAEEVVAVMERAREALAEASEKLLSFK